MYRRDANIDIPSEESVILDKPTGNKILYFDAATETVTDKKPWKSKIIPQKCLSSVIFMRANNWIKC